MKYFTPRFISLLVFFVALSLFQQYACAQTVGIRGKNNTYKCDSLYQDSLVIAVVADPITRNELIVAKMAVDTLGNFVGYFNLDEVKYASISFGVFKGYIYLVPGKSYEISFPDRKMKDAADSINPFFEPAEFYINILNTEPGEVNRAIQRFDNNYSKFLDRYYQTIVKQAYRARLDTAEIFFANMFTDVTNPYFKDYFAYTFNDLKYTAVERNRRNAFVKFFAGKPLLLNNTAYTSLINQLADNYLDEIYGEDTTQILNKILLGPAPTQQLRQSLANSTGLPQGDVLDYVVLKCVYDAIYSNKYNDTLLIRVIDEYSNRGTFPKLVDIAKSIKEKTTKLMVGFPAPQFTLYDTENSLVSLSDYLGSYVYLVFGNMRSYSFVKELGLINTLYESYMDSLVVITISADEDFSKTLEQYRKYEYAWSLLHIGKQPGILTDYQIRFFPTCYLIDPEGKLFLAPAPAPSEGFDYMYSNMIKEIKRRELREQNRR